ncbi:ATP-dependent helicase HrpB [Rhabdaerophilum sp. SD176]|uniref:ATP-dependent helicase HrpB n=1 Tax=Rhabdaerophilum sp. SD176 TaxID=2983548 RepID=UPI0024DFDEBB|nr:ATP-dependent helicase HrpB [Rhabdaerophilum sp. SD176]
MSQPGSALPVDHALPIDEVLPEIRAALSGASCAILVAPPGAGKTTRVPLALMDEAWTAGGTILVLEPRRIAARGAATRMAQQLGEPLGKRVGLRTRLESRSSRETRILVVTEGVFTRMILDDPSLEGIAAVLFDEFHERSLDSDLGLAFALDAQAALRPDLRLLVMSATLDDQRIRLFLDGAPVISSDGRAYPVETIYRGREADRRIEDQVAAAIRVALATERGSILAFLPGQGEIEGVRQRLAEAALPADVDLCPLHGTLEPAQQDAAIKPAAAGRRKVVLATSIAETSITIEGVRVVVDSGLRRAPRYEPDLGIARLETIRISRAAADQRRGRAGRTEPGIAIRLWDAAQDQGLLPFDRPEILDADLSGLRLAVADWGAEPDSLRWLDPPPKGARTEAERQLQALGALDGSGAITPQGRLLRQLPLSPRLASLVIEGAARGAGQEAARMAALLGERGVGGAGIDLAERLRRLPADRSPRARAVMEMAERWLRHLPENAAPIGGELPLTPGMLLALAFPDRIAKARGNGLFGLANGRQASVDPADPMARADYLVVADLTGRAAQARITAAAAITRAKIGTLFGARIETVDQVTLDEASGALRRRAVTRLFGLALESRVLPVEPGPEAAAALAAAAARRGIDRLGWSKAQDQLRDRVGFLRQAEPDLWPDLSDAGLGATIAEWLEPFLGRARSLGDIDAALLGEALDALLPYGRRQALDASAPTHFVAPTGQAHPIRYDGDLAPSLSIRVQELFGLAAHPSIANGKLPLTLELLSPAHRPIQITRDLPGFWKGSWADVRTEMRGRYPRHVWPEDPASAAPTTRAKPRGT